MKKIYTILLFTAATINYSAGQALVARFSTSSAKVCTGETVIFTDRSSIPLSTGTTSFEWTFTGGTPSSATGKGPHTIAYEANGNYNVKLMVSAGTQTDDTTRLNCITVETCSGVNYEGAASFDIYPNPSAGTFILSMADNLKEVEITVTGITGNSILKRNINNTVSQLDLSEHPKGIYLLQIRSSQGIANKKIMIQ